MLVHELVTTWEALRATRSRLAKVNAVSELLTKTPPDRLGQVVSYLSGELPQGKIGLGYAGVSAVDAPAAHEPSLTIDDVDVALSEIKASSGAGSKKRKGDLLHSLLAAATELEQEFLRRLLVGALRQGALEAVMADAIAHAANIEPPLVRRAAMMTGDLAMVAEQALTIGADALAEFGLELGVAVQPMLAQSAPDLAAAIAKIDAPAAVEWKVDGARVQVHRNGDDIQVYTRNLREITNSAPDVVRAVASLDVDSIILDGEAVALRTDNRPVPFQETISRFAADADGQLSVVFFDCLHLNGRDLIDASSADRWQAMEEVLPTAMRIPRIVTDNVVEAQAFFDEAVSTGYESWSRRWTWPMRLVAAVPDGSRSNRSTPWTWWCWPSSGDRADEVAGCRTSILALVTPTMRPTSSC